MIIRFTSAFAVVFSVLVPAVAQADDLMDRYKAASQLQAQRMADFMISRVPEFEGVIPAAEWTPEAEIVGACILDKVRADRGDDGAEAYVAAIEAFAEPEITSLSGMGENIPELLTDMYFMDVAIGCGGMDLAQQQMDDSGMTAMMADPAVMERLAAE